MEHAGDLNLTAFELLIGANGKTPLAIKGAFGHRFTGIAENGFGAGINGLFAFRIYQFNGWGNRFP